jgi:hypothetical protein
MEILFNNFIKEQILSFHEQKFKLNELRIKAKNNPKLLLIEIKNQKVLCEKKGIDFFDRKKRIISMLLNTLKIYKIKDTILLFNIFDSYYWKDDFPVFNFILPHGKAGLIFPTYDFIQNKFLMDFNYDQIKNEFVKYKVNKKNITNNIYFKGANTTEKNTNIRKKLSNEELPLNIIVNNDQSEPMFKLKDHKYLIDLPGSKPWSVRFKYLALAEKVVFRISFFNSKYDESGYWKQYIDIFYKENIDYIHLVYDIDYEKPLSNSIYSKIKNDILKVYNIFEKNQNLYNKYVKNINKSSLNVNNENTYKYIALLINSYTDELFIRSL